MEAITDIETGWLAGQWDGEGSVGISKTASKGYFVQAQMTSTCERTLAHVADLLSKIGVDSTTYTATPKQEHHKPQWHLKVRGGHRAILALGQHIAPHSVTKRDLWLDVMSWLEQRAARNPHGARGIPYTEADVELAERIRERHRRPKPNWKPKEAA